MAERQKLNSNGKYWKKLCYFCGFCQTKEIPSSNESQKKIVKLQKKVLRNLQRENYRILSNYSKKKFVIFEK